MKYSLLTEVLKKFKNKIAQVIGKLYPIPEVFTPSSEQSLPRKQEYTRDGWCSDSLAFLLPLIFLLPFLALLLLPSISSL